MENNHDRALISKCLKTQSNIENKRKRAFGKVNNASKHKTAVSLSDTVALENQYIAQLSTKQLKILEISRTLFDNFRIENTNAFSKWLEDNHIKTK